MVAHPDRGAGNDPEPFFFKIFLIFFFRGVGSLSQQRLNIFTVGNMRVMICLGQGGLRSLSASSCICVCTCKHAHTSNGYNTISPLDFSHFVFGQTELLWRTSKENHSTST